MLVYNFLNWKKESPTDFNIAIENIYKEISSQDEVEKLKPLFPLEWYSFLCKEVFMMKEPNKIEENDLVLKEPIQQEPLPTENSNENKATLKKNKSEENDMLLLLDDLENVGKMSSTLKKSAEKEKINIVKNNNEKIKEETNPFFQLQLVLLYVLSQGLNQRSTNLEVKLNEETLYSFFSDGGLLKKGSWSNGLSPELKTKVLFLSINAFRVALKITLEAFSVEGSFSMKMKELLAEITENNEKWYVGTKDSDEIFKAIEKQKDNLMCLDYDKGKKETYVLRAVKNKLNGQV